MASWTRFGSAQAGRAGKGPPHWGSPRLIRGVTGTERAQNRVSSERKEKGRKNKIREGEKNEKK